MKKQAAVCLLVIFFINANAKNQKHQNTEQPNYAVSSIPDSLKKNADAVMRLDEYTLSIKSPDKAIFKRHTVVTLLNNKDEDEYTYFEEPHNKFEDLRDASVIVYDAQGDEIQKFRQKDMQDRAANDDETLVGDERETYFNIPVTDYPITIEQEYEIDYSSLTDYENWYALNDNTALQLAKITVSVPDDRDMRYKLENLHTPPEIFTIRGNKTYYWELKNMPAIKSEEGDHYMDYLPRILFAPTEFEYDGYKGNCNSWKTFGSWAYPFYNSQEAISLPDERVQQIKAMVADAKTDQEKINILYHYIEKNTRYVSIQLGIGGYKPFPASFVDQQKYGDCKALANYMHAMLHAIDITSYPALVYGGEDNESGMDPAFPENDFNHVILCVPLKNDTVWLDCTDKIARAGILGCFTENRKALLLTPDGSVLVNTPASKAQENKLYINSVIRLQPDDDGTVETNMRYNGDLKELFYEIGQLNKEDQQQFFVQNLCAKQPDEIAVRQIDDSGINNFHTAVNMSFEKVPDFSTGAQLFISPRMYQLLIRPVLPTKLLQDNKQRQHNFYFKFPYIISDTTVYILPAGYTVNNLPNPTHLQFNEGNYESNYTYDSTNHSVTSTATLKLNSIKIPAADYDNMCRFFFGIKKDGNQRIIVTKPNA